MEKLPDNLYHGTPYEIHTSARPFLDPSLAGRDGRDEGDPDEGYIFATPDLIFASIFALKVSNCRSILKTQVGPAAVFEGDPPHPQASGYVYQVPSAGFQQTLRRGVPSGKWAIVESRMPRVTLESGEQTPGLRVTEPYKRVTTRSLIEEYNLRVFCYSPHTVDPGWYAQAVRDALHEGTQDAFIEEAVRQGWLNPVTDRYLEGYGYGTDSSQPTQQQRW